MSCESTFAVAGEDALRPFLARHNDVFFPSHPPWIAPCCVRC
jgi:hypothetical protein